jgi:adenylylsulfate kinase
VAPGTDNTFAIWITGLPASGKSTVTKALCEQLTARKVNVAVLESDALRKILALLPEYTDEARELFYQQMTGIGELLVGQGFNVIFDATAPSREFRERARHHIARLLEVYVECPLDVCMTRDPKGIYRQAREGCATHVPGLQTAYEPPDNPDVVVDGQNDFPGIAARRIIEKLEEKGYLEPLPAVNCEVTTVRG